MMNRIITISREFGSGGRTIGKKLAEKLGIQCYDSELIQKMAQESGFTEEYVKNLSEDSKRSVIDYALTPRMFGESNDDYLWKVQTQIIKDIADKGPCVIVGRCADYILRDKVDCLTVFIHASIEFRAKRIVEVYGERTETPEKRIKEKDKRRAAYHRFYTDMKWGYAQNYDLCIDSSIGVENSVKCIMEYISCKS